MKATMTSKGQITIPLKIRQRLNLRPGTVLEFDAEARVLTARKTVDAGKMRSVLGVRKGALGGMTSMEWLDETRGKVE
jgi:AbrB family looped-hinge helix DNA binding protein